jgi:signal transduction histidine kinase
VLKLCDGSAPNTQDTESTQWYGCESVVHHGGLCERTIAQEGLPGCMAFYEELDMTKTERTQNLSFVNGDTAKFRYYAGVPLSPYGGANIGTVFFFSEKPSEPDRSAANRSYLTEIAKHITRHLEQAVEALQGQRVLRFNNGVASLLEIGSDTALASGTASLSLESPRGKQPRLVLDQHSDSVLRVYQLAAILLYDIFEFDGVQIHEVGASRNHANSPCREGSRVIAQHLGPNTPRLEEPSQALLDKLLELFPRGAVFQVAPDFGEVVAATGADNVAIVADDIVSAGLPKAFPNAGQIILMPLWDTHHECNIGAILGFACDQSRVYLGSNDLTSMSAFCMTIMTQVRRLEAKAMDKVKSDFLGSVSHEMRTPLHGILSCLELFADTISSDHQRELLQTAQYSGMSLLETIDRVLYLSNINSEGQSAKESFSKEPEGWRPHQPSPMHHGPEIPPIEKETLPIIQVCERVLDRAAQKLRLRETLRPDLFRHHRSTNSRRSSHGTPPSLIIVFDTNATWSCSLTAVTSFERVFTNLLVCRDQNLSARFVR